MAVNNDDNDSYLRLQAGDAVEYMDMLSGETIPVQDGHIDVKYLQIQGKSGFLYMRTAKNLSQLFQQFQQGMTRKNPKKVRK